MLHIDSRRTDETIKSRGNIEIHLEQIHAITSMLMRAKSKFEHFVRNKFIRFVCTSLYVKIFSQMTTPCENQWKPVCAV